MTNTTNANWARNISLNLLAAAKAAVGFYDGLRG
jgi:hypothetical protein